MASTIDQSDQIKDIKTQLDFLMTIDKQKEPDFFNAAVDRVIRNTEKLRSDEVKSVAKLKKSTMVDTQLQSNQAWPELSASKPKVKKMYDPKTIATKYYVNFHSGTYHWLSEWRPQSFILVKDGQVGIKLRIDNGKPEINFRIGTSITRWFPILEIDQAVDCQDEEGNPVVMKFKLVPNITEDHQNV
jgi:hypothetical protein